MITLDTLRSPLHSGLVAIAVLTLGCAPANDKAAESPAADAPVATEAADQTPPTLEDFATATFDTIGQEAFQLTDGKWEGEPFVEGGASLPMVWLTDDFYLSADLDGDGAEDAVAHLTFSSGGTGNFGYLAVMGREGDRVFQKGIAGIGARVQIRAARIEGRSIVLDVLQAGPEDAMCCPTELATRTFAMQGSELVETSTEVVGTASLATLEGREWVLRKLSSTEAAPEEPEITLTVEGGRVSGSSGCNNYNGTISRGETATSITVGPLMTTRKACPPEIMNLEQRYTAALQGAESWSFRLGLLVINYRQEETFGSLFFEGREPTPRSQGAQDVRG